jgi:hypothetical protein
MSGKNRRQAHRAVGVLYRRLEGVNLGVCYYCDAPRQCLDHVPPIGLAAKIDLDAFRKNGGKLVLVPSCNVCNEMLGARELGTIPERVCFLIEKYSKEIGASASRWSDSEIDELGRGLRQKIIARQQLVNDYLSRLASVEYRLLTLGEEA